MAAPALRLMSAPAGHDRRDWIVTAPYLAPRTAEREPWGTHHVKLEGSLATACGIPAVAWHLFWGRDFRASAKGACPKCAQVVRIAEGMTERASA